MDLAKFPPRLSPRLRVNAEMIFQLCDTRKEDPMKLESLKDLYLEQLKDLYSAETQLVDALPKMAERATSQDLKKGFQDHLRQTEEHVRRLEQIFQDLGDSP